MVTTHLQFSIVFGMAGIMLFETFNTLSLDKHPIEFGRDFSWLECTSNITTFSSLAVRDSGILCKKDKIKQKRNERT